MIAAGLLLVLWVYTAERWGGALLARWDRYIALREQAVEVKVAQVERQQREVTKGMVTIPDDLEAVIAEESAQFARDELRSTIRNLYAEYADWQKVRRAVGIGALPE